MNTDAGTRLKLKEQMESRQKIPLATEAGRGREEVFPWAGGGNMTPTP